MDTEEKKTINEIIVNDLEVKENSQINAATRKEVKAPPIAYKGRTKNSRKMGSREPRVRPEFEQKLINIRRVARVVSGGRRFSFSVALVSGNKKGSVGVGIGKAGDTSLAIDKATRNAKKNMVNVNLTKSMSIPHEVGAKYSSARIVIIPAPGRGIIAGSSARNVIELAGIKDITAKILSVSKNKLNIARATVAALQKVSKTNLRKESILPAGNKENPKESKEKQIENE